MGSLMAGWDSPVRNPNAEKLRRNSSLTREEIDAFWRSKKQTEEEHLRDISALSPRTRNILHEDEMEANIIYRRSSSVPRDTRNLTEENERSPSMEKLIQKNGWWISSNWAFLNEPPVIAAEGPRYKYASQFHVASKSNSQDGVDAY